MAHANSRPDGAPTSRNVAELQMDIVYIAGHLFGKRSVSAIRLEAACSRPARAINNDELDRFRLS